LIAPGAVFEIPPELVEPPQVAQQANPPAREARWVAVLSNKADCRDQYHPTVTVVLCSAKIEYAGRHDVVLRAPDGGLGRDSIAQTDLVFVVLKSELTDDRFRGILLSDSLLQIRAKLSETLGFPGPSGG
jgi:mRNA-degrading endonuclease toxin of MazEF toxin-antitoxin module